MKQIDQRGSLIIPLVLFVLLFLGASGFAAWAYMGRQDYKDNTDQKIAAAVEVAKNETAEIKNKEFAEKEKEPLKDYLGPAAYGTLNIKYPKTWSAFVTEGTSTSAPIEGYFHPNFVPGILPTNSFALRVQVVAQSYSQELKQFDSQVKIGKTRVTPFKAQKVPSITGARVDGLLTSNKQGSLILLPLRDKTLRIWSEADQFIGDLNKIILPNISFVP